mgnify:CR=1 FL=1
MESLTQCVRERQREQTHKLYYKTILCYSVHRMCSEGIFIQVLYGLPEVLTRTSMLINEPLH